MIWLSAVRILRVMSLVLKNESVALGQDKAGKDNSLGTGNFLLGTYRLS